MRASNILLVLAAAACSCLAVTDVTTLRIRVPEGHDEITYDASSVRAQDLKHWLMLSPVLSQNNDLLVPESVLSCYSDDPAYEHCDPNSLLLNPSNAAHTQQRIQNRLSRLGRGKFPQDFLPIIDYFKAVQSIGLWLNQQEIEFFKTRNVSVLAKKYPSLNLEPKASCSRELEAIRSSTDEIGQGKLVLVDWHNCMWKQFTAARGSYPQAVWDQALRSRGVREQLVVEEDQ